MTTESDNVVVTELAPVATPTVAQKTEKFKRLNFKRWQQKMLFYLTTLNLARFLTEDAPKLKEDEHDIQVISAIDAWKHSDFLCRNYVMNGLVDSLYNDAGAKKFVVVAAIIEKLPPAWKDFKNYLKHKRKEMSIEDLIIRLRIEEDNRRSEKKGAHTLNEAKANFVEHGQSSKAKTNNNKGKGSKLGPKGGISKKPNFKEMLQLCLEVNLVGSNPKEWWIDTGATRHVCSIRKCSPLLNQLRMGKSGQGKVILKMTWERVDSTNVLYVPEIRKNLVSGSLLNNHGFRLVFESNKFILSKSGMYVGKGYMSDGMWKLNVMTIIKSNMNKANTSTYMLESSNLWHVENQLNKKIKVLRSDRGGEYESPFVDICAQHGIIHETTTPYSPQSNGVAERKNRTLKEMMNAMLISSSLPQNMWGEAILTANYLLNKVPKKKAEKTPYELWKGRKPSYTYLRMWGCLAKVAVPPPKKVKIGPKTIDCIFIGYAHNSNAYRFLVYESNIPDIHKNTIMESRNASFFEDVFPCKSKEEPSSSKRMLESQDQNEEVEVEPRRSKRVRTEKSFGPDFLTFMLEGEPQTFKEAVNSTEGLMWKEAIKSEIDSILQNHTWELVDLPPRKMKVDGSIDKYKARLVIKGCINQAFLNGDLDEEIYMEQPEGFHSGQEKKVCKLVKSLYGLKQAIKQWHEKIDNVMMSHGFKINECDKCVYVKDTNMDMSFDDKIITSTKNMLNSRFDMKDMGLADVILGIKIKRTSDELILSQSHYVDKILGKFDKDNSGVARTPVDVTLHLSKNKGESVSQVEYSRLYKTDIAYAVSKPSRYTSNPGAKHWQGIIRVLKYLRFTRDYGLHYTRYPAVLEGYSDANWISNVKDSKSHSGYVFTLGGAAVSWKSSKQTVIARSTMESEFIALDKCGEEVEWLRHFLEDIPRWSNPVPPICIHCDSQSAIGRAQSNMYNGKSRHIRRRHNTIRQLLSTGVISVDYVKSKDNIADPLTKGLNRELVEKSSRGMGLKPIKE
ncbi:hypothetical protein AAG906_000928 [Vitis piasezkii]